MRQTSIAAAVISILAFSIGTPAEIQTQSHWPYGFWVGVLDEDTLPLDFFEIRSDGIVVFWGFCRDGRATGGLAHPFHIYSGDIYVTSEIPGKGPIAQVLRPNNSKTKLTYTSPRTRNNQYYEYRVKSPCPTA